jgi:hypothetical protein
MKTGTTTRLLFQMSLVEDSNDALLVAEKLEFRFKP